MPTHRSLVTCTAVGNLFASDYLRTEVLVGGIVRDSCLEILVVFVVFDQKLLIRLIVVLVLLLN